MRTFIQTDNLSFKYDDQEKNYILDGISLDIKQSEFVCILGQNGSGKSTLAKQFNALLLPTTGGQVFVNSIDTSDEEQTYEIHRLVGMVLQNPDNQIVTSVVKEDVAFGPENLALPVDEIKSRVTRALKAVGLYDLKDHLTYNLSGGQKQRLALAGVLAMQPECIVLDEPTAMLDPLSRKEIMEIIKKINKECGITIVLITHYMDEASLADRVIVMNDGKIILDGAPNEVFSQVDKLKSINLNIPQATELLYKLNQHGCNLRMDVIDEDECVSVLEKFLEENGCR